MPSLRARLTTPAAIAWMAALAALAALRLTGHATVPWLGGVAVVGALAAAVAVWSWRGSFPALPSSPVAAGLFALVAASGGARSPGIVVLALVPPLAARRGGRGAGTVAAGLLAVLVLVADPLLGRGFDLVAALPLLALLAAAAAVPVPGAAAAAAPPAAASRRAADEAYQPGVVASGLRQRSMRRLTEEQMHRRLGELDRYLEIVRDQLGAEEAVYWEWPDIWQDPAPEAWSTERADGPQHFIGLSWLAHLRLVAEGAGARCFGPQGGTIELAAAPVRGEGALPAVLSVSARGGLKLPTDEAKRWLERHAEQVALLVELLAVGADAAKALQHKEALLRAQHQLRPSASLEELGFHLCEVALQVTSGARASYVRWDPAARSGEVVSVSASSSLRPHSPVDAASVVGEQCDTGRPLYLSDALTVSRLGTLFGAQAGRWTYGALAVAPVRVRRGIVGAVVVEWNEPNDDVVAEGKNLTLLASKVAMQIEHTEELDSKQQQRFEDALTGLYNRRYFDDQLARLLDETDRYGQPTALIVCDIDKFKGVNDSHGHEAGDAVLRHVASVLRKEARASDICARYGGEELAVLLPQTGLEGARDLAERLRRRIEARAVRHGHSEISVTASFGVAAYPESARRKDGLFGAADRALYLAKEQGRNQVVVATPSSDRETT